MRRLFACVRVTIVAHLTDAHGILLEFFQFRPKLVESVELADSLIKWDRHDDKKNTLFVQSIISILIAKASQRNERWFSLTMDHLRVPEDALRGYLNHGDSVLLANLIHFTRSLLEADRTELLYALWWLGFNFKVQNTLPGLQRDFCHLWNDIVQRSRERDEILRQSQQRGNLFQRSRQMAGGARDPYLSEILRALHPIYVALHQDQGSTRYDQHQLCNAPSHLRYTASDLNVVDGGRTAATIHAPIPTPALHHHDADSSVVPPVTKYHAPPSRTPNLDHAIPHLVDERSHNGVLDNINPVASSSHFVPPENDRIFDGTAAHPTQGTAHLSAISSMVDTGLRSTSSHGTALQPTRNMTTASPSFVPNTASPQIPILTVSPGPAALHIFADPTVNPSGGPWDDGSTSLSPSQNLTPFPLASQAISHSDLNPTTEIGSPDAPDDTLDLERHIVSHSPTLPLPDITADSRQLEAYDQLDNLV
jgi:hypothetical protein